MGLIFTYCILLTTPLVLWFRVAKRMLPPEATEGAAYDRFLVDFKKRLSRHPRLRGHALNSTTDIETALQKLDKHADDLVTSTASAVFLSTAVLQSGRLDVLVVFAAQTRLIWQIAHVYYQRPSLRDFVQPYANVASTAFIAAGIEDIDVDVLVGTIFGSTVAAIPGMHLLASSILSGSANAFLTLRVGMITKEYCRCTVRVEKTGLESRHPESCEAAWLHCSGGNCEVVEGHGERIKNKTEPSVRACNPSSRNLAAASFTCDKPRRPTSRSLRTAKRLCRCRVRRRALYLALGLKPIVQIVTVGPSTLLVKFVGTLLNLLLNRDQGGWLVRLRGEC